MIKTVKSHIADGIKKLIREIYKKIHKNDGSVYMIMAWLMLAIALIAALYVEYNHISHIIKNVDMAYERAMTAVAVNNYDEVFEAVREEAAEGGAFNGGNEGEYEEDEAPVYFDDSDYGDIEDELVNLLGLTKSMEKDVVYKTSPDGQNEYSLSEFQVEIKQDGTDIDGKYRINGRLTVRVPIYFLGKEITDIKLDVRSKATWRTRW